MNSFGYKQIIVEDLFPFVALHFGQNAIIHQDNDPKYTSNLYQRTLAEFNMATIKAPPYSPDLNPIELEWGNLKKFLRKFRPRSLAELEEGIAIFAAKLTRDKCNKNIIRKVLYWNSY